MVGQHCYKVVVLRKDTQRGTARRGTRRAGCKGRRRVSSWRCKGRRVEQRALRRGVRRKSGSWGSWK